MSRRSLPFAALGVLAACGGSVAIIEEHPVGGPDGDTRVVPFDAGLDDVAPPPGAPEASVDAGVAVPEAGADAQPAIVTLASHQNNPLEIVADETYVYWTNAGTQAIGGKDGAVLKVPVGGGAPVTLWVGPAFAVAVDSARVYWTGGGSIMTLPLKGGSTPTTLVSGQAGGPNAIATDGASVYWVSSTSNSNDTSSVKKIAVAGGVAVTLATGLASPGSIAVDGQNVYWGEGNPAPPPDAAAGVPCVKRLPLGGGTAATLVTAAPVDSMGGGIAPTVVVHDPDVYAAFPYDSESLGLVRVAATGGAPGLALAQDVDAYIAVDGTNVYWTVSESSTVFKVGVGGGVPVVVAANQGGAGGIAVNGESVFWTVANTGGVDGAIMRAGK